MRKPGAIQFGSFTLVPARKSLVDGERRVQIGQRALDLLIALAERPGEALDRDTLTRAVWPGRHIEDSNLRAQIAALRRALGDNEAEPRFILTIPGRGYSFVARVEAASDPSDASAPAPRPAGGGLPIRLQPVIGREADIAMIAGRLAERRLVSIIGAGGVGKTTVALEVARRTAADYAAPPVLLDLSAIADASMLPGQLRAALDPAFDTGGDAGMEAVLAAEHRLVILDGCEPMIAAAAACAEWILKAGPRLHVLATSREPLRAEGEWAWRLPSMDTPPPGLPLTAAALLAFPAVALFVARMTDAGGMAELCDKDAALVAQISRQLDGIPLAIELAATRAPQLGLSVLAERLEDRLRLLLQGRRTAPPRHQTLGATLDWSHGLLSAAEQRLLRRLAVFHGCFTLDAALAVGAAEPGEEAETIERIGGLVDKSFLAVQPRLGETAYRCLDTTRLYLQSKLEAAGESAAVSQRHAQYYLDVFAAAAALWETAPVAEARTRLLPDLDNLRVAIDWSLGPAGDAGTGIALTLAGVPLWSALGLLDEARRRLETAIAADRARGAPDPGQSMRLQAALGSCTVFLSGTVEAAWAETLRLAESLDDTEHRLRALNGLALGAMRRDYSEAERHATRFRDLAWSRGQPDDGPVGDRLLGYVLHMTGRQAEARQLTEAMLARYPRRPLQPHQNKLNMFDQRILSLGVLARIQWLQGETAAALALCDATLAEARAIEHPFSQFFALSLMAAPIALLAGDRARARAAREEMTAGFRQTEGWRLWGEAYHALEALSAGSSADGAAALQAALAAMPVSSFSRTFPLFRAGFAQALLDLGRPDDALAAIEAALATARDRHELWFVPEFLRLRGTCRLARGRPEDEAAAEGDFRDACALAEDQAAGAWALRAATSLARLRPAAAQETLGRLLARFPATADTPDLRAARAVLPG